MHTRLMSERKGKSSLLAFISMSICTVFTVFLSVFAPQNAYAIEPTYDENHTYTSEIGDFVCAQGNWHSPNWAGTPSYDYYFTFSDTDVNDNATYNTLLDIGGIGNFTLEKAEIIPSDVVLLETYIYKGEMHAKITSPNKVGDADLYIEGTFEDGCKLRKKISIHVIHEPFDIKASYTVKRGGEPVVMKYTGSKEGKIEPNGTLMIAGRPDSFYKITLSDNDATLTLEITDDIPTSLGDSFYLNFTTFEREKGDTVWGSMCATHKVKFICDYSGNSEANRPISKPTETKETKELSSQTLRAYTSLLYPFSMETQGVISQNTATATSSNPEVADASYTNNGTLRINGKKAGITTLTIKADNALYDYSMQVTVNAVPIKSENIKTNSTGMKFATMLGGKNVPDGAEPTLEAKTVNSGSSYAALKQAAKNDIIGVYSVNLGVDGKDVHDDFGTIDLTFPVPAEYTNATVRVNHLHEADSEQFKAGEITSEIVPVVNGEATVTVSDLSTFALESNATAVSDNTGSGISGNTNTSGGSTSGTNNTSTANIGNNKNSGTSATQTGQSTSDDAGVKLVKTGDGGFAFVASFAILAVLSCACLSVAWMRRSRD